MINGKAEGVKFNAVDVLSAACAIFSYGTEYFKVKIKITF